MADIQHEDVLSIHRFAYVGTSDPGPVGAFKAWIDTNYFPARLKMRMLGNLGWQDVGLWDQNLVDIMSLNPPNDNVLQRKAGAWTSRTIAQLKADLALTNVPNVDATARANHTGTQTTATISNFSAGVGTALTSQFPVYVAALNRDFLPMPQSDHGIIRESGGTMKRLDLWRFASLSTINTQGVPVGTSTIEVDSVADEDDANVLVVADVLDATQIVIAENKVRWLQFTVSGGRLISSPTLTVPGNVIDISAGDMIQVIGGPDDTAIILQYLPAVGLAPVIGGRSTGYITFTTNPSDGQTKDINGVTVTFKDSPGAFPDVQRAGTRAETVTNLVTALNASTDDDIELAEYADTGTGTVVVMYKAATEDGDAFELDGGTAAFTSSDTTLSNGSSGVEQTKQDRPLTAFVAETVELGTDGLPQLESTSLIISDIEPGTYEVEVDVHTISDTQAAQFLWDFSGTVDMFTGLWELLDLDDTPISVDYFYVTDPLITEPLDSTGLAGRNGLVRFKGTIFIADAGDLELEMVQDVSVDPTTIEAGSSVRLRKL